MNKDIRLSVEFLANYKTKKLRKRLGDGAVLSLLGLWFFAAQRKSDGRLAGMTSEDIALVADWDDDPDEFVNTLISIGFIDQAESGFELHDWAENNPYAAGARARSEKAKKAISKRWEKYQGKDEETLVEETQDTSGIHVVSPENSGSNTPSPSPSPSPEPYPLPDIEAGDRAPACGDSVFLTIEGKDGEEFVLTQSKVDEWKRMLPDRDVEAEIRKAIVWHSEQPGYKQKTGRGMGRFLASWLLREAPVKTKTHTNAASDVLAEMQRWAAE